MKKLMLYKGKASDFLLLMCLFLVQSCKKGLLTPRSILYKSISIEEAKQYFEKNILKFKTRNKLASIGYVKSGINTGTDAADGKDVGCFAFKDLSIGTPGVYIHISQDRMVKYGFLNYLKMYKNEKNEISTECIAGVGI